MQNYNYVIESNLEGENRYYGHVYINGCDTGRISNSVKLPYATIAYNLVDAKKLLKEAKNNYRNNIFSIKYLPRVFRHYRLFTGCELTRIMRCFMLRARCALNITNMEVSENKVIAFSKLPKETTYEDIKKAIHTYDNILRNRLSGFPFSYSTEYDEKTNIIKLTLTYNSYKHYKKWWIEEIIQYCETTAYSNVSEKIPVFEQYPVVKDMENKIVNSNTTRKRKYDLPKWVNFDRAESRNREKVSFQVSIKDKNGKRQKTYKYSVKDAVLWIFDKMVNETKQWTLEEGRDYLNTYKPEMDMVKYEISQDPKSPSVIAYNKQRNIKKLNEMMKSDKYTLAEINEFARVNGIAINFN